MIPKIKVLVVEQEVTSAVQESQKPNEMLQIKHSKIDTSDETNSFERDLILESVDDFFNFEFYNMTKKTGKNLMVYYDDTLSVRLKTNAREIHIWEIYCTEKKIAYDIEDNELKSIPFGDKVIVKSED